MEIRIVEEKDAVLLAELRVAMRKERETSAMPMAENDFLQANIDYFSEFIANGSYYGLIAEEDGKIAATGGICFHNHPPSYGVPNGKSACLLNMYTLPDFRGRGLAGKIVSMLVDRAAECGCCKVYLNASDMGKGVYIKFGFKEVSNEMVFDIKK
ncbi:MAG: GNAT family N-acetyltransferase [Lentisphaeria bacterium]|nr:GNAT family N-acetyltransferase [Lentisphaeria bacterium]